MANWDYVPFSDDLNHLEWIGTALKRARWQQYKIVLEDHKLGFKVLTVFDDTNDLVCVKSMPLNKGDDLVSRIRDTINEVARLCK